MGRRRAADLRPNDAGEPIPAELVAAMRRADDFGKGIYAAHPDVLRRAVLLLPRRAARRPHRLGDELQERYSVFPPLEGRTCTRVRPPRRLLVGLLHLHVVAGHRQGPVLRLRRDDLFAPRWPAPTATRCSRPGGRQDAADLVADFLGRPYSFDSWAAWLQAE